MSILETSLGLSATGNPYLTIPTSRQSLRCAHTSSIKSDVGIANCALRISRPA